MSDPRADRDAYLASVAARLRLPDDHANDVLEELRGHLAESVAGLIDEGLTAEQAERESIARLGDPGELANGIRAARQTRRRLLAAVGAGAIAATGGVVWGYLFAAAVMTVAGVLSATLSLFVLQSLHLTTTDWQPATDVLSIPFALFVPAYAAHRMVTAVAARSERPVVTIQRPIALVGAGVLAVLTIFMVRTEVVPSRVVLMLAIPVGFAIGAMLARDGSSARLRRLPRRWLVALIVLASLSLTLVQAATLRISPTGEYPVDDGVGRLGPPATDVLGEGWLDQQSSASLRYTSGVWPEPANLLDGWHDLRLEVWPTVDRNTNQIDPAADHPAATAPMTRDEFGGYVAQLDLGTPKERRWFVMATTGIAPNGTRYLLSGLDGPESTRPWIGTVWEYLTTP
jgi:hypothetical protein